ncbi:MAG: YIP1 family protein [candidate division WOR-3 bacterium]|nr:YIP1 family protein [candidate division WOR-3 bacterium]
MWKIISAPTQRFQELSTKPTWTAPFILVLLLPLLIATLSSSLLPRHRLVASIEARIAKAKEFIDAQVEKGKMPSDQHDAALKRIEEMSRTEMEFYQNSPWLKLFLRFFIRSLPAVIWSGLQIIIWSAILNLLLPLLGASASFGRTFTITTNSALVRIPAALFHALIILATGNLTAATSLAPLAANAPVYLRGILACIDIFTIYELILVSLGLKVIFNLKIRNTALVVFLIWFCYILIVAALISLSGGLALA